MYVVEYETSSFIKNEQVQYVYHRVLYSISHQLNFLRVFDLCLEMPSDSKNYFGFEVNEFSELVHTKKALRSRYVLENLWPDSKARFQLD